MNNPFRDWPETALGCGCPGGRYVAQTRCWGRGARHIAFLPEAYKMCLAHSGESKEARAAGCGKPNCSEAKVNVSMYPNVPRQEISVCLTPEAFKADKAH